MPINSNTWNRIRYTIYTPVYDVIAGIFSGSRKKAIAALDIQKGEKVLIVGCGTGLDLPYLQRKGAEITGIDITPAMINRFNERAGRLNIQAKGGVMDAAKLDFPDATYDHVVLHLILAVIPDPVACITEAERVLKDGGTASVFDKFVPAGRKPGFWRNFINPVINLLATNINRSFEDIIRHTDMKIIQDQHADLAGFFRIILVKKP